MGFSSDPVIMALPTHADPFTPFRNVNKMQSVPSGIDNMMVVVELVENPIFGLIVRVLWDFTPDFRGYKPIKNMQFLYYN